MRPLPARPHSTSRDEPQDVPGIGATPVHTQTQADRPTWMLTSLLLWLCTLPLVGLLALPWFGARVALMMAGILLVASVTACYGICTWHAAEPKRGDGHE